MNLFHLILLVGIVQVDFHLTGAKKIRDDYKDDKDRVENCRVSTRLGTVQGKVELSRDGKRFCSFLGIPYATKPKRFQEAKRRRGWRGTLNATVPGSQCPQLVGGSGNYTGDENCLFMNVQFPLDNQCKGLLSSRDKLQPVMAFVHGGAFEFGSGDAFKPKYIMDECIIFASMNFRLSALGFLTTNDGLIPGNLAFKDVLLSLKWIQEHIPDFGGNPRSVTLLGHSSGASMVSWLITSPAAKGLFQGAIALGGSALSPICIKRNPSREARELAKRLKCGVDDSSGTSDIKRCLLAADAKDIVQNQKARRWNQDPLITFGPVVENRNTSNPFLTVNPLFNLLTGDFNRVPLIMSFTEDEGIFLQAAGIFAQPTLVSDLNTRWEELAPIHLGYDEDYISQDEKNTFSKKIRNQYFGEKNISTETMQGLIDLNSDRIFDQGIFDTVELYSRYAQVYPFVFTYKKGFCLMCSKGFPYPVATHLTDLMYLFGHYLLPEVKAGTPSGEFSSRVVKLLVGFSRTGKPRNTWPEKNLIKPYKSNGTCYNWYKMDEEITEVPNYLKDRRDFWRQLGIRHYDNPAVY